MLQRHFFWVSAWTLFSHSAKCDFLFFFFGFQHPPQHFFCGLISVQNCQNILEMSEQSYTAKMTFYLRQWIFYMLVGFISVVAPTALSQSSAGVLENRYMGVGDGWWVCWGEGLKYTLSRFRQFPYNTALQYNPFLNHTNTNILENVRTVSIWHRR